MFCGQCGAKNDDNAAFCASCGAALKMKPAGTPGRPEDTDDVNVKKNNKVVGIAAVAAAVIVIVIAAVLIVTKVFGSNYEKTATRFVTALYEMDAEAVMDLVPDEVFDYLEEESDYDIDTLTEELEIKMEEAMSDYWSFPEDIEFKGCEVTGDSDVKGTKLADKNKIYDECDIDISEAKTVKVKVTIEYYGEESKKTFEIPVIKSGRKWYLDILGLGAVKQYYNF